MGIRNKIFGGYFYNLTYSLVDCIDVLIWIENPGQNRPGFKSCQHGLVVGNNMNSGERQQKIFRSKENKLILVEKQNRRITS